MKIYRKNGGYVSPEMETMELQSEEVIAASGNIVISGTDPWVGNTEVEF